MSGLPGSYAHSIEGGEGSCQGDKRGAEQAKAIADVVENQHRAVPWKQARESNQTECVG